MACEEEVCHASQCALFGLIKVQGALFKHRTMQHARLVYSFLGALAPALDLTVDALRGHLPLRYLGEYDNAVLALEGSYARAEELVWEFDFLPEVAVEYHGSQLRDEALKVWAVAKEPLALMLRLRAERVFPVDVMEHVDVLMARLAFNVSRARSAVDTSHV